MTLFETSCMASLKKMNTLYGENNFIMSRFLHDPKGPIFVANVMVFYATWETMASNVISQPKVQLAELNVIIKIHKYRGLYEGHHFILMAMEVHGTLGHDMDGFIKECACLFHDSRSGDHLSLYFCIQFFRQHVNIAFQHALTSIIERKIVLAGDACSRPPITIGSHYLHVDHIKEAVGEITSSFKRD